MEVIPVCTVQENIITNKLNVIQNEMFQGKKAPQQYIVLTQGGE